MDFASDVREIIRLVLGHRLRGKRSHRSKNGTRRIFYDSEIDSFFE